MFADTTTLSQKHHAIELLRSHIFWDIAPHNIPMRPNTRLSKDDYYIHPIPNFHRRYRGIVGSLGHLITITRPDFAWSYAELSKYGITHMEAADHVLRYLRDTSNEFITYTRGSQNSNELWEWVVAGLG
jgi:hypothetical protein